MTSMNGNSGASEHEIKLMIPGNINEVRGKLIEALEKLEYSVVEEQPLMARRAARNGGVSMTSADVLEYPINLHVGLKSNSDGGTTIATFFYRVTHPMIGKGDKQTLNREAEAICALAKQVHSLTNCNKCQSELSADSRFCRRCGTACTPPEPAELEVLRITSKSMVAFEFVRMSTIFLTIALICLALANIPTLPIKAIKALNILGTICLPSIFLLFNGLRHLRNAINKDDNPALSSSNQRVAIKASNIESKPTFISDSVDSATSTPRPLFSSPYQTGEMELPAVPPSVTEQTTALLDKEPQPVPVRREREKY